MSEMDSEWRVEQIILDLKYGDEPSKDVLSIIEAVLAGEHHKAIMLMVNMAGPFLTREELEERLEDDAPTPVTKPCPTCGGNRGRSGVVDDPGPDNEFLQWIPCPTCKGSGKA